MCGHQPDPEWRSSGSGSGSEQGVSQSPEQEEPEATPVEAAVSLGGDRLPDGGAATRQRRRDAPSDSPFTDDDRDDADPDVDDLVSEFSLCESDDESVSSTGCHRAPRSQVSSSSHNNVALWLGTCCFGVSAHPWKTRPVG